MGMGIVRWRLTRTAAVGWALKLGQLGPRYGEHTMARSKKHRIEYANVVIKARGSGEEQVLATLADWVLPILMGDGVRQSGGRNFRLMNQAVVSLPHGRLGLAFEFAKQFTMRSEQNLHGKRLVPENEPPHTTPS